MAYPSFFARGCFLSACGLLLLLLTMPGYAFAENDTDIRVHDWLGWGEFDSAVVTLEKAVQDSGLAHGDAATYAKYWCWLGIAFHGRNQSQAGDSAFRRTLAIQADFKIEENLVTRDLSRRFHGLAESQKQANRLRDSVALAQSQQAALKPSSSELKNEKTLAHAKSTTSAIQPAPSRSTAIWWKTAVGVGAAGVLIAGGTLAYLTWNTPTEKTPKEKIWEIPAPK